MVIYSIHKKWDVSHRISYIIHYGLCYVSTILSLLVYRIHYAILTSE